MYGPWQSDSNWIQCKHFPKPNSGRKCCTLKKNGDFNGFVAVNLYHQGPAPKPKKHCFNFILDLQLLFRLTLKTLPYLTKDYVQVCFRNIILLHLTDSITLDSIFLYRHLHNWGINTEPREYPAVFFSMACLQFQAWRTHSILTLDFCMWQSAWVFSITGSLGFTKPSSSSLYLVFYYFVRTMQVFYFWRLYILFS